MESYLSRSQDTEGRRIHALKLLGLRCPVPLLMTARCLADLPVGSWLEIVGDDPDMSDDLEAWCSEMGHRMLEVRREGTVTRCRIEKSGGAPSQPNASR